MKKIIITLALIATTILGYSQAQTGGEISGKTVKGIRHSVNIDSTAPNKFWLSVYDSISQFYLNSINTKLAGTITVTGGGSLDAIDSTNLSLIKLKTDSVYNRMHQDSVNLAKLGTGVITTLDSATQRTTIKVSNFPPTQAVSGTFWQTTQPVSGTITTVPPSNASSNISQINGITPLMGNGVTGTGSQRVTIASDNTAFSVNTIPSASDSTKYRSTMQISNFPARLKLTTDTLTASLDAADSTNLAGINSKLAGTLTVGSHAVTNAGTFAVQATQSGNWNVNNVSGTVSLPTGASTESTLSTLNGKIPSSLTVTATRLLVDPSGVTSPVSAASLPLPSGASTSANQSTEITSLQLLDDVVATAGSAALTKGNQVAGTDGTNARILSTNSSGHINIADGGNSITVDGTVAATQSGVWNITNVSGTVSLPTGAATESTLSQIATDLHYGKGASSTGVKGGVVLGEVSYMAGAPADSTLHPLSLNGKGAQRVVIMNGNTEVTTFADSTTGSRTTVKVSNFPARLRASTDTVAISGSITSTAGATAIYDSTWSAVQMDTVGLGAKANSATVGWQSDSVGLRQHKCTDVKIGVKISMANTAPANDKAVYVYVYPMWYDGSTWYFTSGGTTTLPSGANSTYTIASPNNLRLLGVLSYTTTNMVLQDNFILSNAFGSTMPDAFGLVIVNFSGAAIHTTDHRIYYSLINKVQR